MVLTMADYYGTLAAARCVGSRGVPVIVAASQLLAPTLWSRFATRRIRCPDGHQELVDWLLDFGRRNPGHVLYPTSDDLVWSFAEHRDELERVFLMYQPGKQTLSALIDKGVLYRSWAELGQKTPRTWFPENEIDVQRIGAEAKFPLLIKPRSQALFPSHVKGSYVPARDHLLRRYREFTRRFKHHPSAAAVMPGIDQPMIQEYHLEAADSIYSLSGFVDETGEHHVLRGARKVLQRPRRIGLGICFEDAPVDANLADAMLRLLRKHGYYGVFEAELICVGEERLLIDLNPRFFGQMAFDIARDAPLPLLVYQGALGDYEAMRRTARAARAWAATSDAAGPPIVHCHSFALSVLIGLQRLSGRMSRHEAKQWRRFVRDGSDMVVSARDPFPAAADALAQIAGLLRHPRWATRSLLLDSA
jgi:predicted ATP-grasp superfamily ATP-dependent carboligase